MIANPVLCPSSNQKETQIVDHVGCKRQDIQRVNADSRNVAGILRSPTIDRYSRCALEKVLKEGGMVVWRLKPCSMRSLKTWWRKKSEAKVVRAVIRMKDELVSHTLRVVTQCGFRDDLLALLNSVFIFVEGSVYSENTAFRRRYTVERVILFQNE